MNNNEYNFFNFDSEDCTSRGTCTLSPGVVSLQELVLYFIKLASFYIVKLRGFELYNPSIEDEIINDIASLIYINEYSEKQMYELAMRCYYIYSNSKNRYVHECSEFNKTPDYVNEIIVFDRDFTLSKSILSGDILIKRLYNTVSSENRNFLQILFTVSKSVCQNISKLFDFGVRDEFAIDDILTLLSKIDAYSNNKDKLSEFINSLSSLDEKLKYKIAQILSEHYGKISEVKVSHSTRKGKCILVSGNNFNDLISVLEMTKGKNIDIYTHSNLLISHSFEKFREYPNLKGHYGRSSENCIVDYGTFPGAILLTKNSKNNTEYLYRGKIFSNDYITPQGVIPIVNNNYQPVIDSANSSVGFKKGRQKPDTNLGFNEQEVDTLFKRLIVRLETGKLKRLFIVGMNSFSDVQKEYFEGFFAGLRTDEFVLSFYYESNKNNVVTINIGNYVPLATYILNKLLSCRKFLDKMIFVSPVCDVSSISSIVRFKNIGADNIYISSCSPRVINPSVFDTFKSFYGVNVTSNPIDDLKQIRNKV